MIHKKRHRIIQLTRVTVSAIIVFFIVRYVKINAQALNNCKLNFNYLYLASSFIILLVYIFNQFLLWHYLTRQNQCVISFNKSIITRAYSEFGKYIPGKVLGYAMLLFAYSKVNQSKVHVAFCMFIELLANVLAATLIFLISVFFSDVPVFEKYRIYALVILALFFILIHPKIVNIFSAFVLKIIKRKPVPLVMSYLQLLKIVFLYMANFMILGVAFMIFINSIYPVSFINLQYITGTTAAAGLIGLFAVFVPAGLGVREGVMVFTLSLIIPPALAGIIALASRIWLTLGEVFLFCLIYAISRSKIDSCA